MKANLRSIVRYVAEVALVALVILAVILVLYLTVYRTFFMGHPTPL